MQRLQEFRQTWNMQQPYSTRKMSSDDAEVTTLELDRIFSNPFVDSKKIGDILEKFLKSDNFSAINFLLSLRRINRILNNEAQTAIHIAAYRCKFEAVDLLFQSYGTGINDVDNNGLSHFHAACMAGSTAVVRNFLDGGLVDPGDCYDGQAALHLAAHFQRVEVLRLLLEHGADPNSLPGSGTSPLHIVCREGADRIRLVHEWNRSRDTGERAETHAGESPVLEMAKILVEFGAEVDMRELAGNTPMHAAFLNDQLMRLDGVDPVVGRKIAREARDRQRSKVEFLLSRGADVNAANGNGDAVLHLAVKDTKECLGAAHCCDDDDDAVVAATIAMLLRQGAEVNAKNQLGESPLQLAVSVLSFKSVEVLLDYNADVADVRFDHFYYDDDVVPCLAAIDNLIKIIDALAGKGFVMNLENNLSVLKFFVVNNCKYPFEFANDKGDQFRIMSLLHSGTDENIISGLEKFSKRAFYDKENMQISKIKYGTVLQIVKHLMIIEVGELYASHKVKDFLKSKISSFYPNASSISCSDFTRSNVVKEIKETKAYKLSECTSLYDILSSDPRHCYSLMNNCDYRSILSSETFRNQFPLTLGIIEGHFSKSLVRWYIVKSAKDYLTPLIKLSLPDHCYDKIFDHLSNEYLLNLCLATVNVTGEQDDRMSDSPLSRSEDEVESEEESEPYEYFETEITSQSEIEEDSDSERSELPKQEEIKNAEMYSKVERCYTPLGFSCRIA